MSNNNDNISFFLTEDVNVDNIDQLNLNKLEEDIMNNMNLNYKVTETGNLFFSNMVNYNENYTVKDLLLIGDYYGISKQMKSNKYNKEQIIYFLVSFESNEDNIDIVFKRKNLWFYMNELKNDKFMKKYLIW